ncbi:MAG: hypothetical protein IKZ12_05445 [Alistipes sp.]|nr:hypothetical protein [Alistipes sp.]
MKNVLLLLSMLCFASSSFAENYGTYTCDGYKYNVDDKFLQAISKYCPAASIALKQGHNLVYYSDLEELHGVPDEVWMSLYGLSKKQLRKFDGPQMIFESSRLTQARISISKLRSFSPPLRVLDLTATRFLEYGIVNDIVKLLPTAENKIIKQRIIVYLNLKKLDTVTDETYDEILVYKNFNDVDDAERYTNSIRKYITLDFWERLETGRLTAVDISILNSYGIFLRQDLSMMHLGISLNK